MTRIEEALRMGAREGDAAIDDAVHAVEARADAEGLIDIAVAPIDTPVGTLRLAATPIGLVKVALSPSERFEEDLARRVSPRLMNHGRRLDPVRRQLDEYFQGKRTVFEVPLDWRLTSGFRRAVLHRLYDDVRFGEVISYAELAELAGSPRASRAVGTAMATNPIPIVVPCHRVLRTGGSLGGYGGGLDMKRALLRLEQATWKGMPAP